MRREDARTQLHYCCQPPVLKYDGLICKMDNRPTKDEDDLYVGAIKDNMLSGVSMFSSYSA